MSGETPPPANPPADDEEMPVEELRADLNETPPPTDPPADHEEMRVEELRADLKTIPEFSPLPQADLVAAEAEGGKLPQKSRVIQELSPEPTASTAWNSDKHAAQVQARLAFTLIFVLVGVVLIGATLLATTRWTGISARDASNFFGIAFAATVTLATAATSFWFGSQKHGPPKN